MTRSIAPTRPLCILHSGDVELRNRLAESLQERAYVCHAHDQQRLEELLGGSEPLLLFIDLRMPAAPELIARMGRLFPHAVAVGLGHPNTEPVIAARDAGLYKVEDLAIGRPALRALIDQAIERVGWMQETQMLREELAKVRMLQQHGGGNGRGPVPARNPLGVQHLVKATRNPDRLEDLFEKIVDGVAGAALVSRVGLFYRQEGEDNYRLQAGRCCLEDTDALEFSERDPLVRWLQQHPRLITRASLEHITDPAERALLRRSLDLLGAETFIPLNLRGRVLGWLFTGQTDGLPFDHHDHPELGFLSEHVVHTLENTIKHHELMVQKHLGDRLLQMMPTAVITVDSAGNVTWSNAPAELMFPALARDLARVSSTGPSKTPPRVPVEDLGSRIAGLLRDTLAGEPTREPLMWENQASGGRLLTIRTRILNTAAGKCIGAVALIDDITDQIYAKAQQEHLERAKFWRELAAGIGHEIRNPLVAIKTMAQLLPTRHKEEEFRLEFTELVSREVGRLDGIVGQIEAFAHPEASEMVDDVNIAKLLVKVADEAKALFPAVNTKIIITSDADLPLVRGSQKALGQALHHIVVNAIEGAIVKKVRPIIKVRALPHRIGEEIVGVKLAVVDNGPGVSEELRNRVFSPFCTTKAQGLGLGLPLAQRVFLDHGGRMELDSGSLGMCVNVTLPLRLPAMLTNAPQPPPDRDAAAGKKAAGGLPQNGAESLDDQSVPYLVRKRLNY